MVNMVIIKGFKIICFVVVVFMVFVIFQVNVDIVIFGICIVYLVLLKDVIVNLDNWGNKFLLV